MGKSVITIPTSISRFTANPLTSTAKRKVAAYARVSTDHEEQQSSYDAQVDYYTSYIKSRSDWEFVSVYADEGISATSTKGREEFQKARWFQYYGRRCAGRENRSDYHKKRQPLCAEYGRQPDNHTETERAWD